jgi:Xaa-Pro aminopeptidase
MKKFIIAIFILASSFTFAQQSYFELLRQDLATKKVALITEVMQFTDDEADVFWPLYREFDFENAKIGDETLKLIKDYAANYENITDEKAIELMNASFDLKNKKLDLKRNYLKKFSKVIAPTRAVKLIQVINQIEMIVDIQIASQLPLVGETIEPVTAPEGEKKDSDL